MLPNIVVNVYYHKCGKICSSNIKKRLLEEAEVYVKKWLECPYCIECLRGE
jgi:hypothetical protein